MDWLYSAFNVGVAGGPLLALRLTGRSFAPLWGPLLRAYAAVSLPWVVLDAVAHGRGWWSYNADFILGPRLLGLPVEEILFFITVPFACMVVYLFVGQWCRDRPMLSRQTARYILAGIGAAALLLGVFGLGHERTLADVGLLGVTLAVLWSSAIIVSPAFWLWNGAVLVLFMLFNSILTAAPIVQYDAQFMTALRIGSIPIEDVLYNFSLLNLFLLIFVHFRNRAVGRAKNTSA